MSNTSVPIRAVAQATAACSSNCNNEAVAIKKQFPPPPCNANPTASKIGFTTSLELVDQYAHAGILVKYETELGLTPAKAIVLFSDVKHFLYLCATSGDGVRVSTMIDRGWHEFILFTKSYTDFCYDILGTFIHHEPLVNVGVSELVASNELAFAVFGELSSNWSCDPANCEDCAPVQPGPSWRNLRIGE